MHPDPAAGPPGDILAAVLQEHSLLRQEIVQVTGRDSTFAAWAVLLAGGTLSLAFARWDSNRIVAGLALCIFFPVIVSGLYRGVLLYKGDVERAATYLMWLEEKYKVLSTNPGALEKAAKEFYRINAFQRAARRDEEPPPVHVMGIVPEPEREDIVGLVSPLGWEAWLRRYKHHPHVMGRWISPGKWFEEHKIPLLSEYARTRVFRNTLMLTWTSGLLGLAYIVVEWDALWYPVALVTTYVCAILALGLLSAVQVVDRLSRKMGRIPATAVPAQ